MKEVTVATGENVIAHGGGQAAGPQELGRPSGSTVGTYPERRNTGSDVSAQETWTRVTLHRNTDGHPQTYG